MSVSPINRKIKMTDPDSEAVVEELKREIEMKYQYGTAAPDSTTVGNVYYKIGAATTDAIVVYLKVGSTWYGG
jgi:hypothetical protein